MNRNHLMNCGPARRLLFGSVTETLLASENVSCAKLLDSGFDFKFPTAKEAIENLLKAV